MGLFPWRDAQLQQIIALLTDDNGNALLPQILTKQRRMILMLDNLTAAVTAENTVIDSAIALLQGLAAQIAALKPNQAAIDALAAEVNAKAQVLADAVTANTPAV